jgi:hypothetical protein
MSAVKSMAEESEMRGSTLMKTSWLVTFIRLLAPLKQKGLTF